MDDVESVPGPHEGTDGGPPGDPADETLPGSEANPPTDAGSPAEVDREREVDNVAAPAEAPPTNPLAPLE